MTTTLLNNRYQVIQVLGSGGFGETFLAEDTYMPSRRRCVIKQLKAVVNPQMYQEVQQRFQREAAALELLGEGSTQIPKLYAYFSETGQFYLVQELIQGQTLTEIVQKKGQLSEREVKEILLSLLPVLEYIHSKGIIHRDIKPGNIIVRSSDGKPVLIDFGAVKETLVSMMHSPGANAPSMVIGTPGYMPNEQVNGHPVYASDLYSLGLTAIFLLTGKQPQELQVNRQTGEWLWQQYAANISPQLAAVLSQAIKPYASDRFTTASKMLSALQSAAATAAIPASQPQGTQATMVVSPVGSGSPPQPQSQPNTAPPQNAPVIPAPASGGKIWQKPVVIGTLVAVGLIGAIALANTTRQQQPEAPVATPASPPTSSPSSLPASEPSDTSATVEPPIVPAAPNAPQPQPQAATNDTSITVPSTSQTGQQPVTSDTSNPEVTPTPEQQQEDDDDDDESRQQKRRKSSQRRRDRDVAVNNPSQSVPAFPTGTSRSTVEATLGKPTRDLRGVWRNTRAVTYSYVPNQIDLGYLFDRDSGALRQTEAAFAQSVDPQVMQNTLQGLLGGQAPEEIKQGLQQVQQRQSNDFRFTAGSVKGQIVRQECDFIYISIWDANLHDFVPLSQARQC